MRQSNTSYNLLKCHIDSSRQRDPSLCHQSHVMSYCSQPYPTCNSPSQEEDLERSLERLLTSSPAMRHLQHFLHSKHNHDGLFLMRAAIASVICKHLAWPRRGGWRWRREGEWGAKSDRYRKREKERKRKKERWVERQTDRQTYRHTERGNTQREREIARHRPYRLSHTGNRPTARLGFWPFDNRMHSNLEDQPQPQPPLLLLLLLLLL